MQQPIALEPADDPLDCALGHQTSRRSHRQRVIARSSQSPKDCPAMGSIGTGERRLSRDRDRGGQAT